VVTKDTDMRSMRPRVLYPFSHRTLSNPARPPNITLLHTTYLSTAVTVRRITSNVLILTFSLARMPHAGQHA